MSDGTFCGGSHDKMFTAAQLLDMVAKVRETQPTLALRGMEYDVVASRWAPADTITVMRPRAGVRLDAGRLLVVTTPKLRARADFHDLLLGALARYIEKESAS